MREFKWSPEQYAKLQPLKLVDYIVVHHTANADVPVEMVDQWHKNRGWAGVGYHYVVRRNGDIERGRPEHMQGAHVIGHNDHSLGVALGGDFTKYVPPEAQLSAAVKLVRDLLMRYPKAKLARHRDLQSTSCPGDAFPWDKFTEAVSRKEDDKVRLIIKGKPIDVDVRLINGRVYAPVRDLFAALTYQVSWDEKGRTVRVE
ncbi:MAG: N-acetylmuramoyl-L-alanine amidase [Bacillota bacterium]